MRALAQKYLFTYLMGHSPRYFQENFAGQARPEGEAGGTVRCWRAEHPGLRNGARRMLLAVGGALMFNAHATYALVLALWAVVYLGIVVTLARRCVVLSKAFSNEVSTSTGR
jgi:ATP-binding cassette subfamily B protein